MNHRNPKVYLPASEARCEPSGPCARKAQCARYMAPIPPMGTLSDERALGGPFFVLIGCSKFVSLDLAKASKASEDAIARRPRTHKAFA